MNARSYKDIEFINLSICRNAVKEVKTTAQHNYCKVYRYGVYTWFKRSLVQRPNKVTNQRYTIETHKVIYNAASTTPIEVLIHSTPFFFDKHDAIEELQKQLIHY